MEQKAVIMVPAGPRAVADGRPEYVARQDMREEITQRDADELIGFGMELKAIERFPGDFNPKVLNVPYGMHAANECLTQLYQAEQEGNQAFIEEFWGRIAAWAKWQPAPLYVNFHGSGLGTVPSIDEHRFELTITPEEWLKRAKWHIGIFTRMKEMGLPASMETVYLCNFYGPPYFAKNWLPITYLSPRVGILGDLIAVTKAAGIGSIVDFEHLEVTVQSLNRQSVELAELPNPQWAGDGSEEFFDFFGFDAQAGKICRARAKWPASWEDQVYKIKTPFYHVGSINPQVFDLPEEEADTEYHRAIIRQLGGNPYAQNLVRRRRGGSHDAVRSDNVRMMEMLDHVLYIQDEYFVDKPVYLTIETSNRGEGKGPDGDPGYWYWADPGALTTSFTNLIEIIKGKLG